MSSGSCLSATNLACSRTPITDKVISPTEERFRDTDLEYLQNEIHGIYSHLCQFYESSLLTLHSSIISSRKSLAPPTLTIMKFSATVIFGLATGAIAMPWSTHSRGSHEDITLVPRHTFNLATGAQQATIIPQNHWIVEVHG